MWADDLRGAKTVWELLKQRGKPVDDQADGDGDEPQTSGTAGGE